MSMSIQTLPFDQRACFIAGQAKSGTTLLVALLDNHPELLVLPEETAYFPTVLTKYGSDRAGNNSITSRKDRFRMSSSAENANGTSAIIPIFPPRAFSRSSNKWRSIPLIPAKICS